jgi:hypothetical protein
MQLTNLVMPSLFFYTNVLPGIKPKSTNGGHFLLPGINTIIAMSVHGCEKRTRKCLSIHVNRHTGHLSPGYTACFTFFTECTLPPAPPPTGSFFTRAFFYM